MFSRIRETCDSFIKQKCVNVYYMFSSALLDYLRFLRAEKFVISKK